MTDSLSRLELVIKQCQAPGEDSLENIDLFSVKTNSRYDSILASCSNITYNSYDDDSKKGFIEAHDCVNGTWFSKNVLSRTDYETLLVEYERYRSDRSRLVVDSSGENLIPLETDITILNDVRSSLYYKLKCKTSFLKTKIMKNQEGCVNTLSMECMDFYYRSSNNTQNQKVSNICRYGRDGANYTSRAIFDCYYNEHDNSSVVLDYQPQRLHNTQIFCNNHHHIISELFSSCCSGA